MNTIPQVISTIANAIRTKTGKSNEMLLSEMPDEILAIETGIKTDDATAVAGDILSGKTAYAKDVKITGTIPTRTQGDLTVSGATVTVPSGYYNSQVSKSVATATQATPSISVDSAGKITASATQTAGYVSAGTKSATQQLTTKAAATITPGTLNQTIAAGTYLTGTQTIVGDADLQADNIKRGVNIFGVNGNYSQINFDVVGGTTQPSNPVENTIWVYTDENNKITSYVFSSQQPTSPTPGMVWFATVVDTNITFNALKENALDIYPITAKQYVSGSFVSREVSIYQEGQWRPWWNGVVFNNGTNYVGGFTIDPGGATATVGNTIYLRRDRQGGGGSVKSKRPVYVRAYTSLKFTMSASWASWGTSGIEDHAVVTVSVIDSETNTTVASKSMNGHNMSSGTHTIPITPPGNFYIAVSVWTYSHYGVIDISISDIHFE